MRRKFGILFLIGITVLAGTQEAAHQFDGLKSSLKNFTRASLWSGLIVYAQPVNDGKLPTPQIYYLMPPPQQQPPQPAAPAAQQPVMFAGNSDGATTSKPEASNNHGEEAAAESNPEASALAAMREVEDAAKSELTLNNLNKLPLNLNAPQHRVAPKLDKVRVYEEVARHEPLAARKLKHETDAIARVFMRELEAVKLVADAGRLLEEQGQLEHLKLKTPGKAEKKMLGETENLHRRMEFRVVRRPAPRPERPERIRVAAPFAERRGVALPEMSSIGCEKMRTRPEAAPATPVAKTRGELKVSEPLVELGVPDAPHSTGNTWTLNCDTEPEQN